MIHHNQSPASQAAMVRAVKRHENGFITDPVVLSPAHLAEDVLDVKARLGFCGIPITGKHLQSRLFSRDVSFITTFVLLSKRVLRVICGFYFIYLLTFVMSFLASLLLTTF